VVQHKRNLADSVELLRIVKELNLLVPLLRNVKELRLFDLELELALQIKAGLQVEVHQTRVGL
jgi:hypothetical protein